MLSIASWEEMQDLLIGILIIREEKQDLLIVVVNFSEEKQDLIIGMNLIKLKAIYKK